MWHDSLGQIKIRPSTNYTHLTIKENIVDRDEKMPRKFKETENNTPRRMANPTIFLGNSNGPIPRNKSHDEARREARVAAYARATGGRGEALGED